MRLFSEENTVEQARRPRFHRWDSQGKKRTESPIVHQHPHVCCATSTPTHHTHNDDDDDDDDDNK